MLRKTWRSRALTPFLDKYEENKIKGRVFIAIAIGIIGTTGYAYVTGRTDETARNNSPVFQGKTVERFMGNQSTSSTGNLQFNPTLELTDWEAVNAYVKKYGKEVTVTAYNSVPWQTDSTPCIAADGTDICEQHEKGIKTCAARYPFGSIVLVPGWGACRVVDRLSSRYASRVDLYFGGADKIAEARAFGKKKLKIVVLR
ncbi:MAG: hypothetical protein WC776_05120 [Patescibacteria group bacterium]|jgi:3D (Asp-Asp-Asp) domain-containing protein